MLTIRGQRIGLAIMMACLAASSVFYAIDMYQRRERTLELQKRIEMLESNLAATKKMLDQKK